MPSEVKKEDFSILSNSESEEESDNSSQEFKFVKNMSSKLTPNANFKVNEIFESKLLKVPKGRKMSCIVQLRKIPSQVILSHIIMDRKKPKKVLD
mmetsp:Transcript_26663/g.23542  ORF Transcript_26663/g.23542 Transcript_26663/m.23542 type:complete len:95 (-) Transcript_26663:8-292(-)